MTGEAKGRAHGPDGSMSDAAICRKNGWGPGTVLEGSRRGGGPLEWRMKITAIGEELALARVISVRAPGRDWIDREGPEVPSGIGDCDWRKVEGPAQGAEEEWYASKSEDDFTCGAGPYASREEAIANFPGDVDLVEDWDPEDGDPVFYTGKAGRKFDPHVGADWVIDQLKEGAFDFAGEATEGWLDKVTREQEADLQARLDAALAGWIEAHGLAPAFFLIAQVESHTLPRAAAQEAQEGSSRAALEQMTRAVLDAGGQP